MGPGKELNNEHNKENALVSEGFLGPQSSRSFSFVARTNE